MTPSPSPLPDLPWQITGNHWLAIPCIHPATGGVHAIGLLHRGARGALEFAGDPAFERGEGAALLAPSVTVDGVAKPLSGEQMAWERALGWLPTFTCPLGNLLLRGTVFAPFGRDADVAGLVYALSVENRGDAPAEVTLALEGTLGHRQIRVRSGRPLVDRPLVSRGAGALLLLEGAGQPGLAALALGADGAAELEVSDADGDAPRYRISRRLTVPAGGRAQAAFYLAAAPERDGAAATVAVLRRRGWRDLLAQTRDALQALEQTTGLEGVDRLVNRNLLFAYFYAVGRALDDAQYYLVRSRAPWHPAGLTVREWEALAWTIPAVQLADPPLARELILRACELHGYAPGQGVRYIDGTLFQPGFSLEGAASYAIAVERYIRETGDDRIVDEPVIADTLYLVSDDIAARRDKRIPLYSSEVDPGGEPVAQPFTLHGNAVVAQALDVLRRTLDEEAAREVEDPEAVRAAMRRHMATEGSNGRFASATDLAGTSVYDDDPTASALWLPLYEAIDRSNSLYRRTAKGITRDAGAEHLARECGRLFGPEGQEVLERLRRSPLDAGLAAELVDAEGRAVGNGGDAALSGLLAWSAWYAVHALGARG
ncbi:MAG: hypothetical protein ACYC3Q_01325 [Gemmatimonadaceae bacterium]